MSSSELIAPNQPQDLQDFDLMGMLRRKFWVLLFFVLIGVGLGILGFLKLPKTYKSEAKIRIDTKFAPSMADSTTDQIDSEHPVDRYIEEVNSVAVLESAIENGKFEELKTFKDSENLMKSLRENFVVKPVDTKRQSGAMLLQFYGPEIEEAQPILLAIITAYDEYIKSHTVTAGGEVLETLTKMKVEVDDRISTLNQEIITLNSNPNLIYQNGMALNPHQLQLVNLQGELDRLRNEKTMFQSRASMLEEALTRGDASEQMAFDAIQQLNESSMGAYVQTHQKLLDLKIQETSMMGEFGEAHPELVNLRNSIKAVEQMKMQELSVLRGGSPDQAAAPSDFVKTAIEGLKIRVGTINAQEAAIRDDMKKEQEASVAINSDVTRLNNLQKDLERAESTYTALLDQLNQYNVLKEFDWKQMMVQNPASPGEKSAPSLLLCLAGGLFLGSMVGLAFCFLQELAAKTFHSSEQIASQLGTKVMAHIPAFNVRIPRESQFQKIRGDMVTLHRPGSNPAEAYRSLRTSMFFKAQQDGSKVFQFTSPTPGDGKSTTAANIAAIIAQSGRKVALVDCDFRRPTQHTRFNLDNHVGVTSFITEGIDPNRIIFDSGVENLSLIPSGPHHGNPSELLTTGHLEKLLHQLSDQFDFVIVDSPPVLPVTDPCIIANFVDAIYMPIRLRKGIRDTARRAIEAMQTVGAKVDGVIVNFLQKKDGGSYRYGDSYSYGKYGSYGTRDQSRNTKSTTAKTVGV